MIIFNSRNGSPNQNAITHIEGSVIVDVDLSLNGINEIFMKSIHIYKNNNALYFKMDSHNLFSAIKDYESIFKFIATDNGSIEWNKNGVDIENSANLSKELTMWLVEQININKNIEKISFLDKDNRIINTFHFNKKKTTFSKLIEIDFSTKKFLKEISEKINKYRHLI